jgi:hypothetical protein
MGHSGNRSADEVRALTEGGIKEEPETDPEKAPAFMVHAVLTINERLERIAEVAMVVLIGALLGAAVFDQYLVVRSSPAFLWYAQRPYFSVYRAAAFASPWWSAASWAGSASVGPAPFTTWPTPFSAGSKKIWLHN